MKSRVVISTNCTVCTMALKKHCLSFVSQFPHLFVVAGEVVIIADSLVWIHVPLIL